MSSGPHLLRNKAAMDYRILYDADTWFECAPSEPIFPVQTPVDAVHVVSSVAGESDADSLIDVVCAGIKGHSLYELTHERDRIESLRNSLENDTGAAGYALITLFVACHVSVEEAKADIFCGVHRSCNGE